MTKTPGEVIEQYIQLRDGRKILAKSIKEKDELMKQSMKNIEEWLLAKATDLDLDSFKSKHGTAYIENQDKYGVGDWGLFLQFINAEIADLLREAGLIPSESVQQTIKVLNARGPWGFFKKDVPQAAMAEYMIEMETVPPGVTHTKLRVVKVNRPKNK